MEAGDFEAGGDRRHGAKRRAMSLLDSVPGNVALGRVPRLEQGTGPCCKTGNALIYIGPEMQLMMRIRARKGTGIRTRLDWVTTAQALW